MAPMPPEELEHLHDLRKRKDKEIDELKQEKQHLLKNALNLSEEIVKLREVQRRILKK